MISLFIPMEPERLLLEAAKKMEKEAIVKISDLDTSVLYNYTLSVCGEPSLADHIVGERTSILLPGVWELSNALRV